MTMCENSTTLIPAKGSSGFCCIVAGPASYGLVKI
jgi:hypothetical protein